MNSAISQSLHSDTLHLQKLKDEDSSVELYLNVGPENYRVQQRSFISFSTFILSLDDFIAREESNFIDLSSFIVENIDEQQMSVTEIESIVYKVSSGYFKFAVHFGLDLKDLFILNREGVGLNYRNFKNALVKLTIKSERFYRTLAVALSRAHSEACSIVLINTIKNWQGIDGKTLAEKIDANELDSNEVAEYLFSIPYIQKEWKWLFINLATKP